ncbi:prepilin-type N-terminal cleavage/methylation domain-containing protein [Variovorax sp. VNK109]|uniref:prepilin-type N-terminal cleavage/methylation domain-containing protein n=1 Tax=Variovorax sp. VNK109 TaxID=3400919 RepID=UPI003C0A998B
MLTGRRVHGFTLIELVVAMAILAALVALGAPTLREFSANSKIRAAAESMVATLQQARSEALTRNVPEAAPIEFVLTNQDPLESNVDAVVPTVGGRNWVVRVKDMSPSPPATYLFISGQSGSDGSASQPVTLTATSTSGSVKGLYFNSLGQLSVNAPAGATGALNEPASFLFSNPQGGNCQSATTDPGSMRCLQVRVSVSGQVRLCDPMVTAVGDSRTC